MEPTPDPGFACQPLGAAEPRAGSETTGAGFFDRYDLPELSLARITPAEIELAFPHYDAPELPTAFD